MTSTSLPLLVAAAVIERAGRVLMTRRQRGQHLEGLWEFPGGKCESGETLEACVRRELREELGLLVEVGDEIWRIEHAYPEKHVRLHFFRCACSGDPLALQGQDVRWVPLDELQDLPVPEADRSLVSRLAGLLSNARAPD